MRGSLRPAVLAGFFLLLLFPGAGARAAVALPAGFSAQALASGLTQPTAVAWAPDGRMFIAEKAGRVLVAGPTAGAPRQILDISDHVNSVRDRGLLGLAVDSDYASNHYLYLLYTYEDDPAHANGPKVSRLTRVVLNPDDTVPGGPSSPTETVLLGAVGHAPCPAPDNSIDCIPSDGVSHSIGTVRSAADGTLWVSSGEGADWTKPDPLAFRAYDEASYAGKVLHVDRAGHGLPGHPFCPGDQVLTDICTKIYAKGFRSPFRFALRPDGAPVVGDVGADAWEEIDLLVPGGNYGWPCWEGPSHSADYKDDPRCSDPGTGIYSQPTLAPAYAFAHPTPVTAVIGGPEYRGSAYPADYQGTIFFGAYGSGFIRGLTLGSHGEVSSVRDFATGVPGLDDLEIDPRTANLVWVDLADAKPGDGSVWEVSHSARPAPPVPPVAGPIPAPPHPTKKRAARRRARGPLIRFDGPWRSGLHGLRRLSGQAADPRGVRAVEVAIRLGPSTARGCRWLALSRGRLRWAQHGCRHPLWIRARLRGRGARSTRWTVDFGHALPRASYEVYFRAVDQRGHWSYRLVDGARRARLTASGPRRPPRGRLPPR